MEDMDLRRRSWDGGLWSWCLFSYEALAYVKCRASVRCSPCRGASWKDECHLLACRHGGAPVSACPLRLKRGLRSFLSLSEDAAAWPRKGRGVAQSYSDPDPDPGSRRGVSGFFAAPTLSRVALAPRRYGVGLHERASPACDRPERRFISGEARAREGCIHPSIPPPSRQPRSERSHSSALVSFCCLRATSCRGVQGGGGMALLTTAK